MLSATINFAKDIRRLSVKINNVERHDKNEPDKCNKFDDREED